MQFAEYDSQTGLFLHLGQGLSLQVFPEANGGPITASVGDDIESDIGGAQAIGMKGILVRTGKYRPEFEENSKVTPDLVIDSVHDLISMI